LIPDPVGKAISCLMDRMNELENQLQSQKMVSVHREEDECDNCEAETLCDSTEPVSMSKKYA
jgi:serine O-acetyltransferase